jgi:signal transduction histidine kinase
VFAEGRSDPALSARLEQAVAVADLDYLMREVPKAIDQSLEGLQRISRIVRAMKDFSHPGGSEKEPANLNQAIETTVMVARNEWKYVADLETDLDANLQPFPCFVGEMNQVFLNLIVNAAHAIEATGVKESGKKGTIRISTRRDGDAVEIRISDSGIGIAPEHRARIFEPFFTTKGVGKGTGQGLALAYQVVTRRHGGTIQFETEVGKGTTFIVRLPAREETP